MGLLFLTLSLGFSQSAWADGVWKVKGDFTGWGEWWCDSQGNLTISDVSAGWHEFLIVDPSGTSSGNNFTVNRSGTVIGDGTQGNNRTFNLSVASDLQINIYNWAFTVSGTAVKRYITGDNWFDGNSWNEKKTQMTWDADAGCYTHTVLSVPAGNHQLKVTDGTWTNTWGHNEYASDKSSGITETNNDGNIQFNITKVQDIVVKYYINDENKIGITATDPINGIAGTFNSWNATTNPLNYSGNTAQTTIALTKDTKYTFKVRVNSDWRGNSGTMARSNCSGWTMSTDVSSECTITPDLSGNYIFIYDKSTGKLTVKYPSTLTLDGNGGEPASQNLTLYIGDEMSSSKFTQPEKTGYDYKGFTSTKDGTTTIISGQSGTFNSNDTYTKNKVWSYTTKATATFYAKWTPHTYTISYKDKSGGDYSGTKSGLVTSHTYATATNLVDGSGKKGYTFIGWYTDINCTDGNKVTTLGATAFSADITLYAKWQANTTAITINKNDGTDGTVSATAVYDGTISDVTGLSDALRTRTGYTFSEINTQASGSGTTIITWTGSAWAFASNAGSGKYTNNATPPVWQYTDNPSLTLNTRWTANPYTVSFYDADDAVSPSQTLNVTYDAEISPTSVSKPTKSGYIFGGYFTGKGGTGTQLTDANGNLLEVAGYFEKQSTKLYWKHADNVTAYAAWSEEKTCSLTFGITDGAQATNERGSLSITFNETEYKVGGLTGGNPSTATIEDIPSGTTLTISFTHRSGSGVYATTPESWWTTVTKTSSAPVTLVRAGTYSFTITDNASIYLWSTLNEYEFAHSVNPAAGGAITTDNGTYIAGPAVQRVLTATPNDGYEFSSWTLSENIVKSGSQTETTNPLTITLKNSSDESVTANFTPITYSITYNGLEDGDVNPNPVSYTIETATITLSDASRDDYTFDGWYDAETEGNKVTEIVLGSFGDKILWARWHETTYPVTINKGTGIESVSPTSVTVGAVTVSENITATVKEGYTWATWQATTGITAENLTANPIQIKASQNGTLTATATENLTTRTVSVNANSTDMGTVKLDDGDVLTKQIGVATTATLTASSTNRNYKFKQWALTNCSITNDKSINDAEITVKGDGTNAATAVAEFEVAWYVCGSDVDIFGGWGSNGHKLTKVDGLDKFTYTIDVQKIAPTNGEFLPFKVYNFAQDKYYAANGYWVTRKNNNPTLEQNNGYANMQLRSDMVGDYVFTLDCTSSRETPILTVTFPGETSKTVIVNTGETETQMDVKDVTPTQIEAPEYLEGMRFDKWVVSGGAISIANEYSHSTTIHGASNDNVTVTATFTTDGMIYFNNSGSWWNSGNSEVYVYLFDDTNGVWWNDDVDGGVHPGVHRKEFSKMERIPNTQIYYYRYTCNSSEIKAVAFSKDNQRDNTAFYKTSAAWRTDFNAAKGTMYMASKDYATKNSTGYHSYGYWKYYHVTDSKFYLQTYEGEQAKITTDHFVNTDESSSIYTMTYHFDVAKEYQFKLRSDNGGYFGNNGKIESSVKGWEMQDENYEGYKFPNCTLKVTVAGDYNFTLDLSSAPMRLSVEYPLSEGDYHIKYTDKNSNVLYSDFIKKVSGEKQDIVSFYVGSNYQGSLQLQRCIGFTDNTPNWADISGKTLDVSSFENNGAYLFYVNQTNGTDNGVTLENPNIKYSGDYYVRSKGAGTDIDYLQATMTHFDSNPDYDYYFCKWVGSDGADVSFCIANDYNSNLTQPLTTDNVATNGILPKKANVRYAWNEKTNTLSRAYLTGSNEREDFLYISAVAGKLYKEDVEVTKVNFTDKFDWVYQLDVKAGNGATVDVIATYNDKAETLVDDRLIFSTTETGNPKAQMNIVYDFKTNRIVAAWRPSGIITSAYTINTDIMLMRNGQGSADQLQFSGGGSITGEEKTVYGAVQFDKSLMALEGSGYEKYDRSIFWISFPFDVRLNDVFGLGQYGDYWIIRYYDGAERASKGWFQETKTFWKTVSVEEREHGGDDGKGFILKANVGYNLVLDYNAVLQDLYPNGAEENYLFFPSKDKLTDIPASLQKESITYDPLTCTITSPVDRRNEDSNWRVIGVPSYADPGTITSTEGIKFFYAWNRTNNTLGVEKVPETNPRGGESSGTFQSMHAYMVQFAGTINWSTKTVTPATAPLFAQTEKEEYSLRLELQQEGKKVDQAYVDLTDDATEDFDLNLDITKLMYSTSQIYSFIGNDKVAANSLPVRDVVVPLCVTAAADGTYTIALPDGTEGLNVTLYDVTAGKETNMSFDGYTVNLDKGEYNNRFLLNISVPRIPTNMRNVDSGEWSKDGKTKKLFINDNIYLINAGRIYNASGTQVK